MTEIDNSQPYLCTKKIIKNNTIMGHNTIDKHLGNFNIAGFTFWDGCEAFGDLKVGTSLNLVREVDNKFDPYAVAIYYKDTKLGFIPRGENQLVAQFMDLGYNMIFDLRVQRICPDAHPEKQVGVILRLKEANRVFNK